jgi:hypothetical protein
VIPLLPIDLISSLDQLTKIGADLDEVQRQLDKLDVRDLVPYLDHTGYLPTILHHNEEVLDGLAHKRNAELLAGMLINYLKIFRDLAPDYLRNNMEYLPAIIRHRDDVIDELDKSNVELLARQEALARMAFNFLRKFNVIRLPLDISTEMISAEGAPETEVCISLATKSIIKVDSLDWKQIMEFRRDREAREKLRRFRLFASANYVGKSKAYVEDDILRRMDEYEAIVKQWRFETVEGAYNMLFSPKMLGTGAGALLSNLFGAPLPAVLMAGAAIELGRFAIYLSKQYFTLRKTLKENPVSYLSYAKKELGSAETP